MSHQSLFSYTYSTVTKLYILRRAQEKPAGKVQVVGFVPAVTSPLGPRAEFLEEVVYYEQRYTLLAEAVPAEKYGWRPGEGVRSIGEVFAHITIANYGIANALIAARTPCRNLQFRRPPRGNKLPLTL